jgi:UDP-3-O-[3-hydroxymyristoyl] N-acetylglucosamine deacetylase
MNANALKALLNDPTAYEVVETSAPRQRVAPRDFITVNAPEFAPWSA